MSIRIGNSCINCKSIGTNNICDLHHVKVNTGYTCDSFDMKLNLKNDPNCSTCVKYEHTNCANPSKATPGMLCSQWAPLNASA